MGQTVYILIAALIQIICRVYLNLLFFWPGKKAKMVNFLSLILVIKLISLLIIFHRHLNSSSLSFFYLGHVFLFMSLLSCLGLHYQSMSEVQVIFVVCVSFISDSLSFCQESLIFAKIQSQVNPFTPKTCAPILRWGTEGFLSGPSIKICSWYLTHRLLEVRLDKF